MSTIYVSEIFSNLEPLEEYKIHFAKCDGYTEPLDVFMRDMEEWKNWNQCSKSRNDFNRKYIFSLISFYPEQDTWLFGGIWEVIATNFDNKNDYPYTIELSEQYKNFIGRLKISYAHRERAVRNLMESYFPKFIIKELLEEEYSVQHFPGYKNLHITFKTLENIISKDNVSWKNALSIKGIYLITDAKTGKKYVGSASGEYGIWQRWNDYVNDGHGGDVDLKKLVDEEGFEYIQNHYEFTLLEIVSAWDEGDIINRENYWKRVLHSRREETGHNKN